MNMPDQLLTACGKNIFITDETKKHLLAHSEVIEFLTEAASKINIPEELSYIEKAVSFNKIIGISNLVETDIVLPGHKAFFAKRISREFPSRVVLNKKGEPCDSITFGIKFDKAAKKYFLATAYIGYPCPDEPFYIPKGKNEELKESLAFWRTHALIYNQNLMGSVFEASWEEVLK